MWTYLPIRGSSDPSLPPPACITFKSPCANNTSRIVVWDPTYFNGSDTMVQIQADFSPSLAGGLTADTGFTSDMMRADAGSYVWNVSSSQATLLPTGSRSSSLSLSSMDVQLYIVQVAANSTTTTTNTTNATDGDGSGTSETATARLLGPVLRVVSADAASDSSATDGDAGLGETGPVVEGDTGMSLAAVLVPLVLVLLVVAVAAAYMLRRRRRQQQQRLKHQSQPERGDHYPVVAASWTLQGRHGEGDKGEAGGVPMGDMGPAPPPPPEGRNVFQEEIRRQEAERRV